MKQELDLKKNWENVGLPVKVPVSKISADIKELFQGDISNEYVGGNIYERHKKELIDSLWHYTL